VLEHREGPFVDGRVYADPALVQELEEYHAGAATAHIEHGPVPIALPAATHRVRVPQAVATTANGASTVAAEPDPLAGP
jgi:cell division protease FtsH